LESGKAFVWGLPHTPFSNSGRNALARYDHPAPDYDQAVRDKKDC
jgi:hypothetical protein